MKLDKKEIEYLDSLITMCYAKIGKIKNTIQILKELKNKEPMVKE